MSFNKEIEDKIALINQNLDNYIKKEYPEVIYEAMKYSLFAGGKRVRPILLLSACESIGGNIENAIPFACALEMIHTYSLIHDDLPAMDNDDFRRGKPTCHKVYGDAVAILAGDALLNKAFEIMSEFLYEKPQKNFAGAMKIIAKNAGTNGMIGGQVADILSENKVIDMETLKYIHNNKTAALIKASLMAGALLGNADDEQVKLFENIGYKIGMAFQIKDDILDVTSSIEVLGKPILSDEKNNKATYVSMYGIEKAEKDYADLSKAALDIIGSFGESGKFLFEYTNSLIERIK